MIKLDNKFAVVTTPSVISYLVFNRAALDYIKITKSWMYQSLNGLRFTSPHNAARIAKVMRKYDNM